jgi:acetyl-CoA carboxylase carboxyl transferase subunit beta
MTWLSQLLAKTGIKNPLISRQSRVPAGLWIKCDGCGTNMLTEKFVANLNVCESCNHHHPIKVLERIKLIMDDKFGYINLPLPPDDPIGFVDTKSYKQRLKEARDKCTFNDSFAIVEGTIFNMPVVSIFMDFEFIGGSMGIALGDSIVKAAQVAVDRRIPLIIFTSSGGARMQEGLFSLMQMPRSVIAIEKVKAMGLPYIAVLLHPTTGGVLASFASRASFTIAEPGAIIGFTGQRVIKDTLGIKLPKGFQTSEFVQEKGFIDQVVPRKMLKQKLGTILSIINLGR